MRADEYVVEQYLELKKENDKLKKRVRRSITRERRSYSIRRRKK